MNVVVLVLQILGILILAVLLLLAIFLLLPAGIEAFWKEQKAEIWLSVGPLRRRFYPPRAKRETEKKQTGKTEKPKPESTKPEKKEQEEPRASVPDTAEAAKPSPKEPQPDEVDRLYESLMGDPMKYVRRLTRWAKGPGKMLLEHLKVRKVRIVWTVTGEDAAATAIAYGALAGACNTAWVVLEDLVDVQAEELRLEPDFTGERRKERCFSCQITARMYIIVASVILTVWRSTKRQGAPSKKKKTAHKTADTK